MTKTANSSTTTASSIVRPRYCLEAFELNSFPITIQSLGYPKPLRGGCFYSVQTPPNVCSIQVDLVDFNLGTFYGSSNQCLNDYLLVNGNQKVCGFQSGKTLLFPVRQSQVTLESITLGGYPGYELKLKAIFCSISSDQNNVDSYGAPQAPVIAGNDWKPIYDDQPLYYPSTSKPDYITTFKPLYTTHKSSYHRPEPTKRYRDWFAPLRSLIRAKQRAFRALFGVFTLPLRPIKGRPHKPSYRPKPHYRPGGHW